MSVYLRIQMRLPCPEAPSTMCRPGRPPPHAQASHALKSPHVQAFHALKSSHMQAFHALRHVDEAAYLHLLHSSLRKGGLLMLLTGNANEPEAGPSVLTEQVREEMGDAGDLETLSDKA